MVYRPIFNLTANEVFELIKEADLEANPLYRQGFKRVGCMPCIMATKGEMKLIADNKPDIVAKIAEAETKLGSTFFPPDYIPERFSTHEVEFNDGEKKKVPTIQDVVNYTKTDTNQGSLFPLNPNQCQSIYNICE